MPPLRDRQAACFVLKTYCHQLKGNILSTLN